MWKIYIVSTCLFLAGTIGSAQPVNNDCQNAIEITDVTNWCSEINAFTNVGATASGYGPATCFNAGSTDVWFRFTAVATDVTVIVNGNSGSGSGGSLIRPAVAIYAGNCGGVINQLECQRGDPVNIVEAYQGGLSPGVTYWIRVSNTVPSSGTFQLCVNNYNAPVIPTSDCPTASVLCDKSSFVVQSVTGAGMDQSEMDDATCFSNGAPVNNESNSTWFTWICDQSGPLTFTLTPNRPDDDLDFVVYELPNGVGNCADKIVLRCMASGDFNFPSKCMGPTGLRFEDTDVSEPAGCTLGSQNNWLAPLNMVAGRTYALAINNFTSSGNGFSIEFGGTGTFLGPKAQFITLPNKPSYCIAEPIDFLDVSSFALGNITQISWYFGPDATVPTQTGPGTHSNKYNTEGLKTIALVVETDLGCQVTALQNVLIETCCDGLNAMNVQAELTNNVCFGDADGEIDLTVTSITQVGFLWDSGSIMPDQTGLQSGFYTVTITNEATCDTVITYEISSPTFIEANPIVTPPTCDGGQDGVITLNATGGVPPYTYDWGDGNGFVSQSFRPNLPVGLYFVTVKDANDCEVLYAVDVRELELMLNPAVESVIEPSCNGYSNGTITLTMLNGLPPYQYNFENQGWSPNSVYTNLSAGQYSVIVRDANNCLGYFTFYVNEPDTLVASVSGIDISCFGAGDGTATAEAVGGTLPYTYLWSNGQSGAQINNLQPGTYTVTVTDARQCSAIASLTIVQPPALFLYEDDNVPTRCYGESNGSMSVVAIGGTPGYTYSLDGGPFQDDPEFQGLRAGTYSVTVRDALGCTTNVSVTIQQPPPLLVDAGVDVTIELGDNTTLTANVSPPFTPVELIWSPETSVECITCPTTIVFPYNNTTFTVVVTDEAGCTASDMVTVIVQKIRDIYIPNAISVDFNGINDRFTIYGGKAAESILELRVFNRWGGLVFEGFQLPLNDETVGWDGTFKGRLLDPEVFAFYALIRFLDGEEIIYKGDIQLIR